ncbi:MULTISPECIES: 3-phosphoshikimate 1-carboxyvinyltransferase [Mesoflavibacter]|uniref:3-phosphoshikimate 1-carboxyvinyltransferase n=1 Tax=Mesoflavibacter profundi TaxID=2708110 RepID=A0ABT4S041_9FLAO|nr:MULTISPECIES: 3-phosphoshikimate 1-carboxyvinyltransferase [Mesoflavibacter]MDA0177421.1 3-phosphoshikimate 1-carboxyvinyltransferase [Mesoflavibacter profundi]QIJ88375.1 3-phosphoshikimate 1-carboxyvinyltransferase [Mesoflavibacter sp. HG96]QIJ91103.1 3-phosphoshikimate 1-carboxyvinyltransferase [Mesoflavibacter sp. HG37]
MNLHLHKSTITNHKHVQITGSKSESNRLLLLQALYPEIQIENISQSDDSQVMQQALQSNHKIVDIHHAGTAMRFLTAYFATKQDRETKLTGSSRMKERPIGILVEALKQLGAKIEYKENDGYPPLLITGQQLTQNKVTLKANVSSQYISALLLIAPKLENGLQLTLEGTITSIPYINMTLDLLAQIGVETSFKDQVITVKPLPELKEKKHLVVESDWSSASYYYSLIALSEIGTSVTISSYKKESLQGDSVLAKIYKTFGVSTEFNKNSVTISKTSKATAITNLDLQKAPDIAQTIAVTAFGLGLPCHLTGLHTLKIKETDRLVALKTEIEKLGGSVTITNDSLTLEASTSILKDVQIETYNDHRMAMAFAPLALKTDLIIKDYMVVSKSYPTFWEDLKRLGINYTL